MNAKANLAVSDREAGYEGGSETEREKLHRVVVGGKPKQVYKVPEEAVAAKVVATKAARAQKKKGSEN